MVVAVKRQAVPRPGSRKTVQRQVEPSGAFHHGIIHAPHLLAWQEDGAVSASLTCAAGCRPGGRYRRRCPKTHTCRHRIGTFRTTHHLFAPQIKLRSADTNGVTRQACQCATGCGRSALRCRCLDSGMLLSHRKQGRCACNDCTIQDDMVLQINVAALTIWILDARQHGSTGCNTCASRCADSLTIIGYAPQHHLRTSWQRLHRLMSAGSWCLSLNHATLAACTENC